MNLFTRWFCFILPAESLHYLSEIFLAYFSASFVNFRFRLKFAWKLVITDYCFECKVPILSLISCRTLSISVQYSWLSVREARVGILLFSLSLFILRMWQQKNFNHILMPIYLMTFPFIRQTALKFSLVFLFLLLLTLLIALMCN